MGELLNHRERENFCLFITPARG